MLPRSTRSAWSLISGGTRPVSIASSKASTERAQVGCRDTDRGQWWGEQRGVIDVVEARDRDGIGNLYAPRRRLGERASGQQIRASTSRAMPCPATLRHARQRRSASIFRVSPSLSSELLPRLSASSKRACSCARSSAFSPHRAQHPLRLREPRPTPSGLFRPAWTALSLQFVVRPRGLWRSRAFRVS